MKLEKGIIANAFALTTAVAWVICSVVVYLFPDPSLLITRWWMHGMQVEVMGTWNLTLGNFVWGGLTITAAAWLVGYIYGWTWEKLSR